MKYHPTKASNVIVIVDGEQGHTRGHYRFELKVTSHVDLVTQVMKQPNFKFHGIVSVRECK